MSEKTMKVRLLNRIDTEANWIAINPKLKVGEVSIAVVDELDDKGATVRSFKLKIGDGAKFWNDLEYITYSKKELDEKFVADGASATKVAFSSPKFNSKNVSAALNELYGYISGVETAMKDLNDEAYEIEYSSKHSGLTSITNMQQFSDYITDTLADWVTNLSDVVFDATKSGLQDASGTPIDDSQVAFDMLYEMCPKNAAGLKYSNVLSGLKSENVQAVIDELLDIINKLEAEKIIAFETIKDGAGVDQRVKKDVQTLLDAFNIRIKDIEAHGLNQYLINFTYDNSRTKIQVDETDPVIHDELNAQQTLEYVIQKFTLIKQNLDGAISVTFDNTNTDIITGTDCQNALEQLDAQVKKNKDDIADLSAADVAYSNSTSGLTATDTQAAIDEVEARVGKVEKASGVGYLNTTSGLTANNVQNAIDELDGRLDKSEKASGVSYDDTVAAALSTATKTVDTVQKAIEVLADTKDMVDDWDDDILSKFTTDSDDDLYYNGKKLAASNTNFHQYASEISYDDTTSGMSGTVPVNNAQIAIETLDSRLDTVEAWKAVDIPFDDTKAALSTTNVQGALEALDGRIDSINASQIQYTEAGSVLPTNVKAELDKILGWEAKDLPYDDTITAMGTILDPITNVQAAIEALDKRLDEEDANKNTATDIAYDDSVSKIGTNIKNVQEAIEGLDAIVDALAFGAGDISYTNTTSKLTATDVQGAIDEVEGRVDALEALKHELEIIEITQVAYDALPTGPAKDQTYLITDAANGPTLIRNGYKVSGGGGGGGQGGTADISGDPNNALTTGSDKGLYVSNKSENYIVTPQTGTDPILTKTTVQGALEELADAIGGIKNATDINFDASKTGTQKTPPLTSTNVQDAVTEINAKMDNIVESQNSASMISYDGTASGLSDTNVQDAIDTIVGTIPTTAVDIGYVPAAGSTLTDTDVQSAIDTLVTRTDAIPTEIDELSYDKTVKNLLTATDGQAAIDELATAIDGIEKGTISIKYDNTYTGMTSGNVQDAIDELNSLYQQYSGQKAVYVEYDPTTSGRTNEKTVQGAIDKAFSEIDQAVAKIYDNAVDIKYSNPDYTSYNNVEKALNALLKQVFYVDPEILTFAGTPAGGYYEVGSQITSVTFNWTFNKTMQEVLLTGCTVQPTDTTATYSTMFDSDKTFTMVVTDAEKDATGANKKATKTIEYKFIPAVYYGCSADPATYDSTFVLGLSNKKLGKDAKGTYSFNAGAGEYIYFALPDSFGTITEVLAGGFSTTVIHCDKISHTNAYGNVQDYNIYKLAQAGLGKLDVTIQ